MKIIFIDSTNVAPTGPGSPAYFSRFLIAHLRVTGHEVEIHGRFDARACSEADAVVCEWVDHNAYEAAGSGVCKRLVLRMRGYEAFGPLQQLEWTNVDALVYESAFLQQLVGERHCAPMQPTFVVPSGVNVKAAPFKVRKPGPVIAMVGRGVADKGWQLAWEWARQRQGIFGVQLHAAIVLPEPRLLRYLEESKPSNVTIHRDVDTLSWLDAIDANYLLSASSWESLGYTVVEALACGIKPLVHEAPGARDLWRGSGAGIWRSLDDLDSLLRISANGEYNSERYRAFVEQNFDAVHMSAAFVALLELIPARTHTTRTTISSAYSVAHLAMRSSPLDLADAAVTRFRDVAPARPELVDERVGTALQLAGRYYAANDLPRARVWALRAMADEARPDPMCLLGEIAAAEDDLEGAVRWYEAACALDPVPSRYTDTALVNGRHDRLTALHEALDPQLGPPLSIPPPSRYLVVVAARNAEMYIEKCLQSIRSQTGYPVDCVVIDDASTDGTWEAARRGITLSRVKNHNRLGPLANIVNSIRTYGRPNDVIVIVDGDDALLPGAFDAIDAAYRSGAWLTYGNFITPSGRPSWMAPYPQSVLRAGSVRRYPWRVSHPKTFKKALFDLVPDAMFKDANGNFFTAAADVALMLPMLELAAERSVYIESPIYLYNDENPQNEHKVAADEQIVARDEIYSKPALPRLDKI